MTEIETRRLKHFEWDMRKWDALCRWNRNRRFGKVRGRLRTSGGIETVGIYPRWPQNNLPQGQRTLPLIARSVCWWFCRRQKLPRQISLGFLGLISCLLSSGVLCHTDKCLFVQPVLSSSSHGMFLNPVIFLVHPLWTSSSNIWSSG